MTREGYPKLDPIPRGSPETHPDPFAANGGDRCDCRAPAPSRKRHSIWGYYLQCLGCNGWVSYLRISSEGIKVRD